MCLIKSNLPAVSTALAWSHIRSLVMDIVTSPHTKRPYGRALDEFMAWH